MREGDISDLDVGENVAESGEGGDYETEVGFDAVRGEDGR